MHSSVRIVVLDYYMSSPIPGLDVVYSEFRGTSINQVPILRCFGSTENGKKICVHIHGVFPYLYIPYDGKGKPEELMYQIASALDRAINVSFNQSNSNAQHVYKISLVSGIPMYGFHSRKHQFFKIYLYNPKLVSRAGSMLLNKHILDRVFQPHEIHLNFTLQFMIDYNLHGMSNMLISDMKYRANPSGVNSDIDKTLILPPSIERTSTSELECDTNAEFILNRQEILSGNLAVNPGIAALWEDEKQRRRNKNEDSQLGKFLELKNMNTPPTKTHLIFQQALRERLAILSTDNELPKQDFEASIYPAETPSDSSIQNASLIDIHSTSSLEFSLDDTLDLSCSQHNKTLTPSGETLNVTMDDDAQEFLHLLQDLAEEKITEDETEEASILSQVVSADQNDDLVEDLDLSMPLEAFTTPIKLNTTLVNDKSDEEDADYFNTTLIPQLDGQTEYTDSDEEDFIKPTKELLDRLTNSCRKSQLVIKCGKAKYLRSMSVSDVCSLKTEYTTRPSNAASHIKSQLVINSDKPKCRRSMPLLDVCSFKTDYTTRSANSLDKFNLVSPVKLERITSQAYVKVEPLNASKILLRGLDKNKIKRAPEAILEEKIRLICHRINRIASKSKIKRIGKLMLTHEKSMMNSFKKTAMPKFNVLPACKWFLGASGESKTLENEEISLVKRSTQSINSSKRPRLTIPNIYINCDGTADSSSEDEQKKDLKKGAVRRKLRSSHYAPLGITVTKSPVTSGNFQRGFAENAVQFSGDRKFCQENASQLSRTESARAPISYKRQLTFEHETLNKTSYEEHFSCTYSSKSVPKIKKSNGSHSDSVVTSVTHSNTKLTRTEQPSLEDDSYQNTLYSITVEPNNSETCESTSSSDSDLFSEVSKRYDRENKYTAKEGCSTVFTPTSMPCSKASSKSQESKVLSSSTSSDIPPYQNSSQNKKIKLSGKTLKVETSTDNFCKSYVKPSFKAPTRLRVEETLTEYQIPRVKQQEPFYSCVDDYSGIVEIGHRIMRIASKTTAHLSEFDSEFDGLNSYRKHFIENAAHLTWNANNIKHLKMAHCSSNFIIVHPVKKPPSAAQVKQWVKMNSKVRKDTDTTFETKTKQTKIHVPNSPGNDSDLDLSLTLTPITTPQLSISNSSENHSYTYLPNSQYSASQVSEHKKSISELKTMASPKPSIRDSLLSSEETNKSYQITGVTQDNSFGFEKSVQNLQAVRALTVHQYLTTMVMELHIRTRGELKPDPELDNICGIFYSVWNDIPECGQKSSKARGVIAINCLPADLGASRPDFLDGIEINCDITYVETEDALISSFVEVIRYWDPDIFAGYEIEMLSWGYLVDRAHVLSINILPLLGRSELHKYGKVKLKTLMSEVESNIVGRIVLDVWRVMRHEIALQSYTFESIVYHILHRRIPFYQCNDLTFWWDHRSNLYRHRVVRYYLQRVDTVLELFDKLDFLNRTSELARLFGILFYEVLSRGSQFRVESMMLRLAKPLNYVPVSPDTKQRAKMRAPEYIPLVMEPESKFYTDPVIVLDFQSLYPSIIIAYNYCFTTCVGRVSNLGTNYPFEFGATQLKVPKKIVEKLLKRDLLNISPCGVAFVKQKVREGILPRMLKEVLDTRLMVKNSMKENKGNGNLQKVLHNRQLGLKLIANVTYGYTAANFSGRMCCVEVGDSVVSKGRETLQRAIALVESTPDWQAKVVYGDTDSMFVLTPGKTKEEAFEIGKKIADAVTADNPDPVTLKLEKVYQPCILQTKKRYVGYMYEGPDQKEPVYEAKGIETVRRDGCPAVSKMLQKCLTILFETKNVSLIKSYVLKQFNKIQTGRASIQDLTFAKEYRGNSGYKPGACVPALELARRWKAVDKRSEPRSGERVPYIIVNGPPGLPLIRLVKSPRDLLNDSSLRPNALYYITKVIIPPINRCLNLIGADLNVWFSQMPRKNTQYLPNSSPNIKSTISQYFITRICASCSEPSQEGLCAKCCQNANVAALVLTEKLKRWEENYHNTVLICQSCTGYMNEVVCASLDCPVLYRRTQTFNDLQQSTYVRELLTNSTVFAEDHFFESLY